jgi:beta-glucanase (GH16 family)
LVDPDTPPDVYTKTGFDGEEWTLVFSDEFEVEGRSFYPGGESPLAVDMVVIGR